MVVFRFSRKWRERSPSKAMERTYEKATEARHAGRESCHPITSNLMSTFAALALLTGSLLLALRLPFFSPMFSVKSKLEFLKTRNRRPTNCWRVTTPIRLPGS